MSKKVAIVGSRDFPNMQVVRDIVRAHKYADVIIVSGGARGVDSVAEDEAKACGLEVLIFQADWEKYGKSAGFIRNKTIITTADQVIAFWDGQSKGTQNSIQLAMRQGKPLVVHSPGRAETHNME